MSGNYPHRRRYEDDQATGQSPRYRQEEPAYYDRPGPYDEPEPDPENVRQRQRIIYQKIANVVWLIAFFVLAIITLRVLLLLINANEENPFVSWVYSASEFFVRPFLGITEDPALNGAVFEVNSLIAMLIYALLVYGILQLVRVILDLTTPVEP
jgi:Trk-type K+ transport system membrane component